MWKMPRSLEKAKGSLITVPVKNFTIPHSITGEFKSAKVLLKPAAPGTGVIAGGPVRAVMDAIGIHDILSKSLGSKNTINIVKAVFNGFENILNAREIAKNRGKTFYHLLQLWQPCST